MHLRFFDFFGFIVSQFSFRRQGKRKNLKKINLKNSGEKSVEAGNSKAKMLFSFMQKAAHCQKPNLLNGVSPFLCSKKTTPKISSIFGEKEAKRPQSRGFSSNSFRPKAGPKFRLTAKTELGEGRSSDDCKAPKGRGPRKSLLFWGEGGAEEQATDFFKEKIGAATTAPTWLG